VLVSNTVFNYSGGEKQNRFSIVNTVTALSELCDDGDNATHSISDQNVAGPRVWNSLPAELQQCSSLRQFKRCLKTFLFGSWDYGALWLFVKQRRIEIVLLTYLLIRWLVWQRVAGIPLYRLCTLYGDSGISCETFPTPQRSHFVFIVYLYILGSCKCTSCLAVLSYSTYTYKCIRVICWIMNKWMNEWKIDHKLSVPVHP